MAAPGPLGSRVLVPDTNGTNTVGPVTPTPTVQVPQKDRGLMSRHDMIMLFSREVPLAMAKPVPQGTAPAWAVTTNTVVKTAATEVSQVTSKVDNLFHTLLPIGKSAGPDGDVTLQASVTIQKKLLVLDLSDLIADNGDDLAEVLGQHVTIQLVSTKIDPSKSIHDPHPLIIPFHFVTLLAAGNGEGLQQLVGY